jgi:phosphoadenosine phosphosulfate reductase
VQQGFPEIVLTLDELTDYATRLLKEYEPKEGYYGCFSGGKDSVVIKELARLAGVQVAWHYNVTTIDPPELVRFIKDNHSDVIFEKPKRGFFTWMKTQGIPMRRERWCCRHLKERSAPIRSTMIFGVRASESPRRAKQWGAITAHTRTNSWVVSPIISWKDEHVWEFIRSRSLPYCSLYDEGFSRLGCIGCPMGTPEQRKRQFARWPKFQAAWKRAFQWQWEHRHGGKTKDGRPWFGDRYWTSWEEMWDWWLSNKPLPTETCQGFTELFS